MRLQGFEAGGGVSGFQGALDAWGWGSAGDWGAGFGASGAERPCALGVLPRRKTLNPKASPQAPV